MKNTKTITKLKSFDNNKQNSIYKKSQATLGILEIKDAVKLPHDEDKVEWVTVK
jgi:hypothetical protein